LVCKNINPSPIKKIINKKVTLIVLKDQLPVLKRRSPNYSYMSLQEELLLSKSKNNEI